MHPYPAIVYIERVIGLTFVALAGVWIAGHIVELGKKMLKYYRDNKTR